MQEVQTLRRRGVRPSRMRIRWMLGFQRRGLRLWEKLTDMPKPGCLPQMSQTAAMVQSLPRCVAREARGWARPWHGEQAGGRAVRHGSTHAPSWATRRRWRVRGPTYTARVVDTTSAAGPRTGAEPLGAPLDRAPETRRLAGVREQAFGYRTERDLLEHYPRRYLTRGEL